MAFVDDEHCGMMRARTPDAIPQSLGNSRSAVSHSAVIVEANAVYASSVSVDLADDLARGHVP